jgi:hypothetical protein
MHETELVGCQKVRSLKNLEAKLPRKAFEWSILVIALQQG